MTLIRVSHDPIVDLFVTRTGAGPVLLAIHGGPDWDHTYLKEPLTRLPRHQVVLPDLRGCGRSTRGLADYSPESATADLVALLGAIGAEQADVLGFSYGGMLAQRLALAAPERVRRLVVASSTLLPVPPDAFDDRPERADLTKAERDVWADPTLDGPALTRAAAFAGAPANVWRAEMLDGYRERLAEVRFSAEWLRPFRAGTLPSALVNDAPARLAALGLPILILHGRQDLTFPAALAERAATLIPSAETVILEEAGHMAHVDQPGPWLETISAFLA